MERRPLLLELVECRGERRFQLQRLLDLIRAYIRILAIFQKTWHLMFSEIPDDSRKIFSPVLREAFKVYEYRRYSGGKKYRKSVIHIFVEGSVKYALIHEIKFVPDGEHDPPEEVQLQRSENGGIRLDCRLNALGVAANRRFLPRFHLRENREAIVCRRLREERAIGPVLALEIALFGDRNRGWREKIFDI